MDKRGGLPCKDPAISRSCELLPGYDSAMHKTLLRILSAPKGIMRWLLDGDPHGMATDRRSDGGQHGAVNHGLANNQY
jgi:hypothetical protein